MPAGLIDAFSNAEVWAGVSPSICPHMVKIISWALVEMQNPFVPDSCSAHIGKETALFWRLTSLCRYEILWLGQHIVVGDLRGSHGHIPGNCLEATGKDKFRLRRNRSVPVPV